MTGLAIRVGDKEKFVGKVADYQSRAYGPIRILYREAHYADFYSHKTAALSVDKAVADCAANELGATHMVCYCTDTRDLFVAPTRLFAQARIVDLGERPQYRIPLEGFVKFTNCQRINLGYTKDVRICP